MATVTELLDKLEKGIRNVIDSDFYRAYLQTMSKFYHYSWGNTMLIYLQKPRATYVAGFVKWRELGRYVKKGEKGIAILVPCTLQIKDLEEQARDPGTGEIDLDTLLDMKSYYKENVTHFLTGYVFDVSQTEGKPLPEVQVPTLSTAPPLGLWDRFDRLRRSLGLDLKVEDMEEFGYLRGTTVALRSGLPEGQKVKTYAHEIAHFVGAKTTSYARGEVLAESVAFVVCGHFGFDTGARSFSYVAIWAKDFKVLQDNLLAIRKISGEMIEKLEK